MTNAFSASEILGFTRANQLFPKDPDEAEALFKKLRSEWHPDKNKDPKANDVFTRINDLYNKVKVVASGKSLDFDLVGEKVITIRYKYSYSLVGLGVAYVGVNGISYHIVPEYGDLVKNWDDNQVIVLDSIAGIAQAGRISAKSYEDHLKLLQGPMVSYECSDGCWLVVQKIPRLYVPLRQLLEYYDGKMPAKQAAWVITRMFTSACMAEVCGMVTNSLTLDSMLVFPGPGAHGGVDMMGFGFYSVLDGKLKFLPEDNFEIYPQESLDKKQATSEVDVVLLKRTGLRLLGDASGVGTSLLMDKEIPEVMVDFLRSPTKKGTSTVDEYARWHNEVLIQAFGPRVFTEGGVTTEDIYEKFA